MGVAEATSSPISSPLPAIIVHYPHDIELGRAAEETSPRDPFGSLPEVFQFVPMAHRENEHGRLQAGFRKGLAVRFRLRPDQALCHEDSGQ